MDTSITNYFIKVGYLLGSEVLSLFMLMFLYALILLLWKIWAKDGLYLYNILAVIIANIQVLKLTPFFLTETPVALGTLLFSTTFLVSDILTEHYGVETAKRGIGLSFAAQVIMTIIMIFTISYPIDAEDPIQIAFYTLFAPSLRILAASLISYYICQLLDIKIFKIMKNISNGKLLWLRSVVSTMISGLMDNFIFSLLAWVILSPQPVSFQTLIIAYVFATYVARVVVSITSTPIIYLTYKFAPNKK